MSHSIKFELVPFSNKFRAIVTKNNAIAAIYEALQCWQVLEKCEADGFETVGYIEELPEPTQEQLDYWCMSREEFDTEPMAVRLQVVYSPIHKDGDAILGDEHSHCYGDKDLVSAICVDNNMSRLEFLAMCPFDQHSAQRAWVNGV